MCLKASDTPGCRMYYNGELEYLIYVLILFGLFALLVTLYKIIFSRKTTRHEKYLLLGSWAIIPPTWFVIEYFFIYLPNGIEDSFKYFSYGQSVASKLWGAVSALITLVIYKDIEKEKQDKKESEQKDKEANESKTANVDPG